MPRRIESLSLAGPAGRLEALLEEPEAAEPVEAALVCHPHPQHGGTMHNKVVYRIARGLRNARCVVLRFNYRGVNLSEGEYGHGIGETDDASAALEELARRYPALPLTTAGFSFGSRVVLRLAGREPRIRRVVAAGFPASYGDYDYVSEVRAPKYFVQSTNDEFGPRTAFETFFATVPEPKRLDWIEAGDHFFKDALEEFERAIERIGNTRRS